MISVDRLNSASVSRWGQPAVLTFAAGGSRTINAIYQRDYAQESIGGRNSSQGQPTILALNADVAGLVQGDGVLVAGIQFHMVSPEPDDAGMTKIILRKS